MLLFIDGTLYLGTQVPGLWVGTYLPAYLPASTGARSQLKARYTLGAQVGR